MKRKRHRFTLNYGMERIPKDKGSKIHNSKVSATEYELQTGYV